MSDASEKSPKVARSGPSEAERRLRGAFWITTIVTIFQIDILAVAAHHNQCSSEAIAAYGTLSTLVAVALGVYFGGAVAHYRHNKP